MFNDRYGLTLAVLEGRKTMTRRLIPREFFTLNWDTHADTLVYENANGDFIDILDSKYCHYKVGEIVAVAQSYRDVLAEGFESDAAVLRAFEQRRLVSLTNKMFVKPGLMPHRIRITDVRVERLQDISDEDCLREGIRYIPEIDRYYFERTDREEGFYFTSPRAAFAELIDRVSGRGTWDRNPYVVAYEFELLK